jgi:hypothetical protein
LSLKPRALRRSASNPAVKICSLSFSLGVKSIAFLLGKVTFTTKAAAVSEAKETLKNYCTRSCCVEIGLKMLIYTSQIALFRLIPPSLAFARYLFQSFLK